jgi:hypothetical protein
MRTKRAVVVAGASVLLAAAPAWAHHAFAAEFDAKRPVHLEGVLAKVELINPHTWIHVDVKGPDGKVTTWMVEAGSPNVLLRRGLTKDQHPDGHAGRGRRVSVQGRLESGERKGYHASRRSKVVPRFDGYGRAVR